MEKISKIVKRKDGYHVVSEEGKNLGGPYDSHGAAKKRLNQVEMFKHMKPKSSLWTKDADLNKDPASYDPSRWYVLVEYEGGGDAFDFGTEPEARALEQKLRNDPRYGGTRISFVPAKTPVPASSGHGILTAKFDLHNPNVLIGTSGFKYKHWFGTFYPAGLHGRDCLAYYATKFPTVEASATFHNMPEPRVITRWRDSVPSGFTFALRGPKEATHVRHLLGCGPLMSAFCRRAEILGDKLGPITFQLMESEYYDPKILEAFVNSLPSGFRYSIEFRSEPWYNESCYEILSKKNIASVIVGHSNKGIHTVSTADWSHIRMSGHHPDYSKNTYSSEQLMNWRGIIADAKRPTYVYFNNEFKAYAADNAMSLMGLMGLEWKPVEAAGLKWSPAQEKTRTKKEVGPKKVNLEPSTPSANPGEQNGETRPDLMHKDPYRNNDDHYNSQYPAQDW